MKIIDLLVKISKGEEIPKKIKYEDDIYIHVDNYYYFCEETNEILSQNIYAEFSRLNDEVEIIEEDKKIEMLELSNATINEQEIEFKINEIIDKVNKINIILSPLKIDNDKCVNIEHLNKGDK